MQPLSQALNVQKWAVEDICGRVVKHHMINNTHIHPSSSSQIVLTKPPLKGGQILCLNVLSKEADA